MSYLEPILHPDYYWILESCNQSVKIASPSYQFYKDKRFYGCEANIITLSYCQPKPKTTCRPKFSLET